ncbi:MAG: transglycosylase family protein [Actinomycetota bacterium]
MRVAAAVVLAGGATLPNNDSRASAVATLDQRLTTAEARLGRLVERSGEASRDLAASTARLDELRAGMDAASSEIEGLARRATRLEDRFAGIARELYMGAGIQSLESLLSARSIADVETRIQYLSGSQRAHLDLVRELRRDRVALDSHLDELDAARAEAEKIRSEALRVSRQINREVEAQERIVADLQAELALERRRAAKRRAARIDAALERAHAASERTTASALQVAGAAAEVSSPSVAIVDSEADWDLIAQCESSGNWHIDSLYDGGLQFDPDTWLQFGGGRYARYAWQASREQQIVVAERVLDAQGPRAWPNCFEYA